MDRLRTALFGYSNDALLVQVALASVGGAYRVGFVGVADVLRDPIDVGIDGDRTDAEVAQGAHNAERDFAAVCDKNFGEH